MKTVVLVNPGSAQGRTGRRWPELAERLGAAIGPFEAVLTAAPMDAVPLAAEARRAGCARLVVVGGDGTVNEAVNGLLADDAPAGAEPCLAFVPQGTGGDFGRSLGLASGTEAAIAAIAQGRTRRIDVGRADFADGSRRSSRYFVNVASFGMGAQVALAVNAATWSKKLGGSVAFYLATMRVMATHANRRLRLAVDGEVAAELVANTVAVCNGRYFGGAMFIAPMAEPDDGRLDIVVLGDLGLWGFLRHMPKLYAGRHLELDEVTVMGGGRLEASGAETVHLEVDGEAVGRLPASFDVVPGAISVVC
jgi:YegS/Rv2252/BmrU family lipid kinase